MIFPREGEPVYVRDYWSREHSSKPIVIKEALALLNTLSVASESLANQRVDAQTDSLTLVQAWKNEGGKSIELTAIIKQIFELSLKDNIKPRAF